MTDYKDLIDRLRCQYALGQRDASGMPEFGYRDMSGHQMVSLPTGLMLEAADVIEALLTKELEREPE